jgi:DNA-binding CsgD family transcriptional regulator
VRTIVDRDVDALLRLTATRDEPDTAAALPWAMLDELRTLIPCDDLLIWGQDFTRGTAPFITQERGELSLAPPQEVFDSHYWDCLSCAYPERSGDLASVTRLSDFYDDRTCRTSAMARSSSGDIGILRELRVCIPAGPGRILRLLLWRGPGPDFTERDRAILSLLRPHLHMAYLESERRRRGVDGLTKRQTQVLACVAAGYSNTQIARRLGMSEGTVRKHLENIFSQLHVHSRTAAVALYRPEDVSSMA